MGESKRRLRGMLPDETALIFNEKTNEFRVVMAHDRPDLTSMHKGSAAIIAVAIKLQKDPQWVDELISTYLTKRETPAPEPVEHKMSAGDVSNGALLTGLNVRSSPLVQAAIAAGAQLIPASRSIGKHPALGAPYGRPEDQLTPEQAADPYGYIAQEIMSRDPEWDRIMAEKTKEVAEKTKEVAEAKAKGHKTEYIIAEEPADDDGRVVQTLRREAGTEYNRVVTPRKDRPS